MKNECAPRRPPSPPPSRRAALLEAFRAQTSPHVDAVYSDALCLTGRTEEAADLVVAAYVRAFAQYERFRRRHAHGRTEACGTLAWLHGNLHAAFWDEALALSSHAAPARTGHDAARIGGRP